MDISFCDTTLRRFDLTRTRASDPVIGTIYGRAEAAGLPRPQADFISEVVGNVFESGGKMADISVRLADATRKHISESVRRAA